MGDSTILEESKVYWEKRYESNKLEWHIDDVHPQLRKRIDELTGGSAGKKFFLPLCGKTKDIPYLLSLGHEVFGVDCVKSAIEQLNEENNLGLQFDEAESLFSTEDRKLQIYLGDFFNFPVEKWGPFDCVWDRGSFIAIDYLLRDAYMKTMQRSLSGGSDCHEFRYLLQTVRYDRTKNAGPPMDVSEEDIANYFEKMASVKELERRVIPADSPIRQVSQNNDPDFQEIFFLLATK